MAAALAGQRRVLELMAGDAPLPDVLAAVAETVGRPWPGVLGAVVLLEPAREPPAESSKESFTELTEPAADGEASEPRLHAAPRLYTAAGAVAGEHPAAADMLAAVLMGGVITLPAQPVVIADLSDTSFASLDGLATALRPPALRHGLRGCWTAPVVLRGGGMAGVVIAFAPRAGPPDEAQRQALESAAHLAAVAVDRDRGFAADAARRKAEARFHNLVAQNPLSVQTFAPDGAVRAANPAWERLFGVTVDQIPGYNVLHDPQLLERGIMPLVRRAFAGEAVSIPPIPYVPDRGEYRGQERWCAAVMYPVKDEAGRVEEVVLIHEDMTERQKAQEKLALYREIVANSNDGIAIIDPRGFYVEQNAAHRELTGFTDEDLRGRTPAIHLGQEVFETIARALAECGTWRGETVSHTKPGVNVPVELSAFTVRGGSGEPVCYVGVKRDISERKRHEQWLRLQAEELKQAKDAAEAARAAAEAANAAKDQFLAVLSHELRTPLTPVLMTVSALEDDATLPADVMDDVHTIRRNVELEARLIDDLLDLTRITQGKLQLVLEPSDVHAILAHAVETCRCDERVKQVELVVEPTATRRYLRGDPARLQQVFWNLIKNAMKFTPEGGRVTVRTEDADDATMRVLLSDTGIGIEPAKLAKIFEAFEQGERQITRRFGGLGLGLTISRALVELHGGRIAAASEGRGRGATFTVTLPATTTSEQPPRPAGAAPAGGDAAPPGLRILLVEDNESTARVMARLLRNLHYEVTTAHSFAAALEAAGCERFDLVVSDLGLPDGSGLDLMRQLRDRYRMKGIALSGYGMEDDIRRSAEAGFATHLTKPINLQQLRAAIRDVASAPRVS